jgi:conjugative transfer pilus assembly protein TraH
MICLIPQKHTVRNGDGEFGSMLGDEFNLVWKALSKGAGGDKHFKELMMSVSGTIIGKKEDGRYKFTSKPSFLQDKELLERYIGTSNGESKIKLYSCNDAEKCLNPSEIEKTLTVDETLYGNVAKIMRKLVDRVIKDDPNLSDEEQALLGFSTIPILNLIEMELASKAKIDDLVVRLPEFIEVTCYDVITNYMQVMLARVVSNVQALEHAQIDDVIIRRFIEDAENTRKFLQDAKFGAFQKLQVIMQVKERLDQQNKEFEFRFGNLMQNLER